MTANPADAVREAPTEFERIIAEMGDVFSRARADFTHDELAAKIAAWADRLAALAGAEVVAPWPDFAGQTIHDRDRIRHPDGTTGVVLHLPDMGAGGEAWRVVYSGGDISRLALQVGDKGQAVVIGPHAPAKAREERAFAIGWRTAANWMERDDLIADIGSPAYTKDRDAALATFAEGES